MKKPNRTLPHLTDERPAPFAEAATTHPQSTGIKNAFQDTDTPPKGWNINQAKQGAVITYWAVLPSDDQHQKRAQFKRKLAKAIRTKEPFTEGVQLTLVTLPGGPTLGIQIGQTTAGVPFTPSQITVESSVGRAKLIRLLKGIDFPNPEIVVVVATVTP